MSNLQAQLSAKEVELADIAVRRRLAKWVNLFAAGESNIENRSGEP